ncbi:HutD family protein [Klebsiella pneumoniae]
MISWPPGQADFDWRASIATVAQDGPFSRFPRHCAFHHAVEWRGHATD